MNHFSFGKIKSTQFNSKQNKTKQAALSNSAAIMYQREIFLDKKKNQ